ncbi:MAG: hypothetical protein IRY85_05620 [Micromonosporaceae bacterium]|nr:hypothetical protein [Micromonosporaceae bacterium]
MSEPLSPASRPPVADEDEESRFSGLEDWIATIVGLALIAAAIAGLIPKGLVP